MVKGRLNMSPGERAQKIKDGMQVKSAWIRRFCRTPRFPNYECTPILGFRKGTTVCPERGRLYMESFKATEGEPMVVRRAKALAHILDNMTIYIMPHELIVGNFASNPTALSLMPELGQQWFYEAMDEFEEIRDLIPNEDVKREVKELLEFWNGRSVTDLVIDALPEDLKDKTGFDGVGNTFCGAWRSSEVLDLEKGLKLGLNGVIKQVEDRLVRLEAEFNKIDTRDYASKKHNLKAMLIALKAGARFGKRYADKARELAEKETDERRRAELNRIAEVCDWVPANPARTLYEAVQSCFFINLIGKQTTGYGQSGGNRLDVIFNPYYQKDKEEGRIAREEAQELMECWLLKFLERGKLFHPNRVAASPGNSDWVNFVIGGLSDGKEDVTNEFSFIVLDALAATRVTEPTISIRYNSKTPDELLSRAIDILSTGLGHPNFFNDEVTIKLFEELGVSREVALNWGISGCVGHRIPGRPIGTMSPEVGNINFLKCFELALYQGMDKPLYTGKQLGLKTPGPRGFTSIEGFMQAYLDQVRFFMERQVNIMKVSNAIVEKFAQLPFNSAFIEDCIEAGRDCTELNDEYFSTTLGLGLTNIADSLAAIKKFVFQDKVITMDELIQACWTNFEGKEELRQRLINEAPKYGNDDDYVDLIARDVQVRTNEELMKLKNLNGFPILLNGSIAGGYLNLSKTCGATPDGRMDSEGCADAVVSPMAGRDKKGPTAVLKSVSKVPVTYGHLLNQKFLPQFLEGENKKKFIQYIRSWGDLGIYHIQFNAVDKKTLLDAQTHPELYQDLVVRVAGYSAYFVDLNKDVQDQIIIRTEQGL